MESTIVLVRIFFAHLITDFVLQPRKWVLEKREKKFKSLSLYLHVLLTGIVVYLFAGNWYNFILPLYIALTHYLIDLWKSYKEDKLVYFITDQILHILVIISGWWLFIKSGTSDFTYVESVLNSYSVMVISAGYIIVIWPFDYLIKLATDPWRLQINSGADEAGLKDAGKWIGKLERILIVTFILMDNLGAIGFLIAAKSVFRLGEIKEKKDRQEAEYILIGTLLSFTCAIIVGAFITIILQ